MVGGSSVFSRLQARLPRFLRTRHRRGVERLRQLVDRSEPGAHRLRHHHRSAFPSFHTLDGTDPANPANYTLNNIGLGPPMRTTGRWAGCWMPPSRPAAATTGEWKFGAVGCASATRPHDVQLAGVHAQRHDLSAALHLRCRRRSTTTTSTISGRPSTSARSQPGEQQPGHDQRRCGRRCVDQHRRQRECLRGLRAILGAFRQGGRARRRARGVHARDLSAAISTTAIPTSTRRPRRTNSYTNDFPTLQGRYYFSDELVGRLTYATGIARPGFDQITPGASHQHH